MKNIIKVEEGCMLLLSVILNSKLPYPAWLFWLLFLTPDVGMIGYVINRRIGALSYNLLHHKGVAILYIWRDYTFQIMHWNSPGFCFLHTALLTGCSATA
jgi:hypothetical protein